MPRGVRKHRQVYVKVWFSNGGSFSDETTRDLTEAEFVQQLRAMADRLTTFADSRTAAPPKEDPHTLRRLEPPPAPKGKR